MKRAHFSLATSLIVAAVLAGCVSLTDDRLLFVAAQPTAYVGRDVRVCGWVRNGHEDHGIWASRRAHRRGDLPILGLDPVQEGTHHETYTCLSGRIIQMGCGTNICFDTAAVDYWLREARTVR